MSNRRNLILLFFSLVVVMMGFGMVIPILPFYTDSMGASGSAMGLNNAFMSMGRIVGPTIAGFVFDLHLSLPYISGVGIMLFGFLICMQWLQPETGFQSAPASAQD